MDEVVNSYILAFDEINALTTTSYTQVLGEDSPAKIEQVTDDILSFLIRAYAQGIQAASKMLIHELTADVDKMRNAIYTVIDGKTFEDRVIDHILANDLAGLVTMAESEYHRIYNTAVEDGAMEFVEEGNFRVTKNGKLLVMTKCVIHIVILKVSRCRWKKNFTPTMVTMLYILVVLKKQKTM